MGWCALELFRRAEAWGERVALQAPEGTFTYGDLLRASRRFAAQLASAAGRPGDLGEARIAYLVPPGFTYVAVQWAIWRAGGVAVPLAVSHPPAELAYVLDDAEPAAAVAHPDFAPVLGPLAEARGIPLVVAEPEALRAAARAAGAEGGQEGPARRAGQAADAGRAGGAGGRSGDADPAERGGRGAPSEWSGPGAPAGRTEPPGPGPAGPLAPPLPELGPGRRAMMIYTSGTTSRPKGVVTTHGNLEAQVRSLVEAWEWSPDDHVLLVLPLHHVHGIVNVLTCALWSGARVTAHPRFDAAAAWEAIARGDLTLFMAVPTIYARLIAWWEKASPEERARMSEGCRRMRLMVSGSAALPVSVLERWREISGHTLLERYGMTEIGMALSNPLHGERRPGYVGQPLPGVEVRLVDEEGREVREGRPGEIEVRGPNVFLEYWRRPAATREAFRDGWFRTGDVAVVEDGYYRILGRQSVDIIKTGGYKVSALEIEEALREHPLVAECAVVGVPDADWGERVAAAVVLRDTAGEEALDLESLRAWAAERLAPYKLPTLLRVVPDLPRNAMGKVVKPEVRGLFA